MKLNAPTTISRQYIYFSVMVCIAIILQWVWVFTTMGSATAGSDISNQTVGKTDNANASTSSGAKQGSSSSDRYAFITQIGEGENALLSVAVNDGDKSVTVPTIPLIEGVPSTHNPVGFLDTGGEKLLIVSSTHSTPSKIRYSVMDIARGKMTASLTCRCTLYVTQDKQIVGRELPAAETSSPETQGPGSVVTYDQDLKLKSKEVIDDSEGTNGQYEAVGATKSGVLLTTSDSQASTYGYNRLLLANKNGTTKTLVSGTRVGNMGIHNVTVSEDEKLVGFSTGMRQGSCDSFAYPKIYDVTSQQLYNIETIPSEFKSGYVGVSNLGFDKDGALKFAWFVSGANEDWSEPCQGNKIILPTVYSWKTGSELKLVAEKTELHLVLASSDILTIPRTIAESASSYPKSSTFEFNGSAMQNSKLIHAVYIGQRFLPLFVTP